MTELPKIKYRIGTVTNKNKLSRMIVYITIVAVRAADNFSWARTKNATAEPPKLVGETAELNSQMKINSIHFHQENSFLVNALNR